MSVARPILSKAQSVLHQPFSQTYGRLHRGEVLEAYCAAFVRWCFNSTGKPLPIVAHPEFYQHLRLPWIGVENTADGLSGKGVGNVVPKGTRAGDILLFRNTYGSWAYGTITHVGIASESAGMMYDAGSGSIVHHRSIEGTFPKLLVEVRRPAMLGGGSVSSVGASGLPLRMEEHATRIHYHGGQVSAKYNGKPVGNLNVLLYPDGRGHIEGHNLHAALVSLTIHDASGKVYKMYKHHGKSMMTDGVERIFIQFNKGLLEVSVLDSKNAHSGSMKGKKDEGFTPLKPTSLELVLMH